MNKLFSKFLHAPPPKEAQSPAVSFPQLAPFNSLHDIKQRAITGWIAHRLAIMLDMDKQTNEKLFFLAFTTHSFTEIEDESCKRVLTIADSAVHWLEKNSVVGEEIKQLELSPTFSNVLSRVISEVQSENDLHEQHKGNSEQIWEVYRDVIYAATHGSFLLIDKEDVQLYKQGELLCEAEIKERKDIPKAREIAQESFNVVGLKSTKAMSYKLIISEAVTNILKHAEYGKMQIYRKKDLLHVVIEDKGTGFPLKLLPQTTLMAGFSTKKSLGQGFTLMMKMADQVVLETSPNGSTLILILNVEGDQTNDKHESK